MLPGSKVQMPAPNLSLSVGGAIRVCTAEVQTSQTSSERVHGTKLGHNTSVGIPARS